MSSSFWWKLILSIFLILFSTYVLVPTFFDFESRIAENQVKETDLDQKSGFFAYDKINLGLDLQGGLYLELDVDLEEALENRLDVLLTQVENLAKEEEIFYQKLTKNSQFGLIDVLVTGNQRLEFTKFLRQNFGDAFEYVQGSSKIVNGSDAFQIVLKENYISDIKSQTLSQAEEAVRNRIDRFGVVEAGIQQQGDNRLIIEMPGIKDPDQAIDVVKTSGVLEFKLVEKSLDPASLNALIIEAKEALGITDDYIRENTKKINEYLKDKLPEGTQIAYEVIRSKEDNQIIAGTPYLLRSRVDISGDMLKDARINIYEGAPQVTLTFNQLGTKSFAELTKENINRQIAIVLDGYVNSAPVVNEPILNGQASISFGARNYQSLLEEAEALVIVLREGALPATMTIATKTVIGPSLGADSIKKGLYSLLLAAGLVMVFMIIYYRASGIIATLALIFNVLFIFAILTLFGASLTLPGMAGIVLTLGMAVDANIIIFERMKEEKKLGQKPKFIVESGYGNAMSAIFDANITTFIAGVFLFQFGTGPIKGFATTLMIGILTTLFTGIVMTRLVFDYLIYKKKVKTISI